MSFDFSRLKNAEDVEKLLLLRRKKMDAMKLAPPDRAGMAGELKHPTLPGVVTGWFTISPAKALAWLDYNRRNRKLNKHKIMAFVRQHARGEFVATHQGIAFCRDEQTGEEWLIDGQHTLKMIVASEQPLTRLVTFGLPMRVKNFATMDVVDVGGRSVADQLLVSHGIAEGSLKKQLCVALASLCLGTRARNLQVGETLSVMQEFAGGIDFVVRSRSTAKGLKQAGVLAAFALAHEARGGGPRAEQWLAELNEGRGLADEAGYAAARAKQRPLRPLEHLRRYLLSPLGELFNRAMNRKLAELTLDVLHGEAHRQTWQQLIPTGRGVGFFAGRQRERVERVAALFQSPATAAANARRGGG